MCQSPVNFNIYSKEACKHINQNCSILQFADDTVIYWSHDKLNEALYYIQDSIDKLISYFEKHNLYFSPQKCKLFILTRKKFQKENISIKINNSVISPVCNATYLGLIIDDKLK